jgi:serine phosphatase RsbU (regulator of sigma subunit)
MASANTFLTYFIVLIAALVGVLGTTLTQYGSTPTDENLFTQPPSAVMLTAPVDGRPVQNGQPSGNEDAILLPGDLVILAAGTRVSTTTGYLDRLSGVEGPVSMTVVRGGPGQTVEALVDAAVMRQAATRDVSSAAYVVDVTAGGASARAGMRVGDLILRINGKSFRDIVEADGILRGGTVGRSTDYDVLRANRPITLRVTLASFGLRLSIVTFSIAGVGFMIFGACIGLARPRIAAARYLALSFVLVGAAVSLAFLRRPFGTGTVVAMRDLVVTMSLFMGIATATHAWLYFPRARPTSLAHRWVVPGAYLLALASVILSGVIRANVVQPVLVIANLAYMAFARWLGRSDLTLEAARIARIVTWTKVTVFAVVFLTVIGVLRRQRGPAPDPGFTGLLLLLVPAVHVWAIGRYRLLDLNLRLRRHVQYSLVSTFWGALPVIALLSLVLLLPQLHLPIPHVRIEGSSVEILQTPVDDSLREVIEKVVLMLAAIGVAFGLRDVGRRGQQWIANQFYRAEHDYRRAAKEVSKLVTSRPDLEGLAVGLVDAVVRLLQIKRAGVLFFHQQKTYCQPNAHGFTDREWKRVSNGAPDILEGVKKAQEEVTAEYVYPRLRRLLADVQALYLYPLRSHDEPVGALVIGEKLAEDVFREEDFEFMGALAAQVAPAVENAFLYAELAQQERLKHELEIARRIQLESLPQFTPRIEGLDIAGISIPAFEVGGDYFDYLDGDPRHLTVMVGDVSGKGTSAALYMSKLQGIVRSLHVFDLTPHDFFVRTNDLLCRDLESRSFVTALGGFFDTAEREVVLARAGHLPLYYFAAATGQVHRMLPNGLGFGMSNRHTFDRVLKEQVIRYSPGDVFLFITDGITESFAPGGDDFGEERVVGLLQQHAGSSALAIRDEVTSAVRAFTATAEQFDDQTVVVVKAI